MRLLNISNYTIKRNILFLCVFPVASFIVFFITGFILYTPPEIEPPFDSMMMTMRIERTHHKACNVIEDKKQAIEEEKAQSPIAVARLPLLNERPEKVSMAKEYNALLGYLFGIALLIWKLR